MCWVHETTGNWDAHPADLIPEKALYGGAFGTLYRIAVSRWKEGPGGVNIPMPVSVFTRN